MTNGKKYRPIQPPQLVLFDEGEGGFTLVQEQGTDWERIQHKQEELQKKRTGFLKNHPALW